MTKDDLIKRVRGTGAGFRPRVNANCIDCIYDPKAPGNWRQQVEACSIDSCAFYDVRPTSHPSTKPNG